MRFGILQLNPTIGAYAQNSATLLAGYRQVVQGGAELVVAPELSLSGYPPRDLLNRPHFVQEGISALVALAAQIHGPPLLVGAVVGDADPLLPSDRISNAAVWLEDGSLRHIHRKVHLPTYDVFDERRYFTPGAQATVVTHGDLRIALTVCEDIWLESDTPHRYERDLVLESRALGCDLVVNLSASPFYVGKAQVRERLLGRLGGTHGLPVLYVNQVGGNDSLVFDGHSLASDPTGAVRFFAPAFVEFTGTIDWDGQWRGNGRPPVATAAEETLAALRLGLLDYTRKCGFKTAVLGLSGGIDSAVTAAVACATLGPDQVVGITMPSPFSSEGSVQDSFELGRRLGMRVERIPIDSTFDSVLRALNPLYGERAWDVSEENLQARIRGTLLMAYSNKFGALLLSTGNKSELGVGYCTLYGDMCGGLALISDLYKTEVYALARHINAALGGVIPEDSMTKPPSAELRPNQTDQDSLPPYEILDAVLRAYVDEERSVEEIARLGFDEALVRRVVTLAERSEYKRRQMPPGIKLSPRAFGEGRRVPLARLIS